MICASLVVVCVVFFKQKTAYDMRISDWSSDVCSSDLDQRCALDRIVGQINVESRVVLEVDLRLALLDLVQRRQADVDVAALDQLRHLPVEEGQQQGADVGAVDVGVGHDDDAVVAQLEIGRASCRERVCQYV